MQPCALFLELSGSKRFVKDRFNFSCYEIVRIYYNVLKGEYNDKHIRQLGMNNGADEHSIMGREIGIMCVVLLGGILLQRI